MPYCKKCRCFVGESYDPSPLVSDLAVKEHTLVGCVTMHNLCRKCKRISRWHRFYIRESIAAKTGRHRCVEGDGSFKVWSTDAARTTRFSQNRSRYVTYLGVSAIIHFVCSCGEVHGQVSYAQEVKSSKMEGV